MGKGFMTGFVGAATEGINQLYRQNALRSQQEEDLRKGVLTTLLKSDDPDVQALALSSLMEGKGKVDWLGRIKPGPGWQKVRDLVSKVKGAGGAGDITSAEQPGKLPGPIPGLNEMLQGTPGMGKSPMPPAVETPAAPGAAALPASSPVQGGGPLNLQPGASPPPSRADLAPTPGAPAPGEARSMVPPVTPGLAEQVAPSQQMVTPSGVIEKPEQALAFIKQRDPLGMDPFYGKLRNLISTSASLGIPWEKAKGLIRDEMMPQTARLEGITTGAYLRGQQAITTAQTRGEEARKTKAAPGAPPPERMATMTAEQASALGIPGLEGQTGQVKLSPAVIQAFSAKQRANISAAAARSRADLQIKLVPGVDAEGNPVTEVHTAGELRGAAAGAGGVTTIQKPETGQAESQRRTSQVMVTAQQKINKLLDDPKVQAGLGSIAGLGTEAAQKFIKGESVPPEMSETRSALHGFMMAAYAAHGYRSAQDMENTLAEQLGPRFSAANLKSTIEGFMQIPKARIEAGRPKAGGPPPGRGAAPAAPTGKTYKFQGKQYTWADLPEEGKAKARAMGQGE